MVLLNYHKKLFFISKMVLLASIILIVISIATIEIMDYHFVVVNYDPVRDRAKELGAIIFLSILIISMGTGLLSLLSMMVLLFIDALKKPRT